MARKRNPHTTERRWRTLLTRLERSGQSVAEFAARHGVSTASVYHWRKRFGRSGPVRRRAERPTPSMKATFNTDMPANGSTEAPFVRLKVAGALRIEVEFPSGVRIQVPPTEHQSIEAAISIGGGLPAVTEPASPSAAPGGPPPAEIRYSIVDGGAI